MAQPGTVMTDVGSWKWVEVGLLLVAGVGFAWWQLRDVSRAQRQSREQQARRDASQQPPNGPAQDPPP
jgi:hypothetical protein